MWVPDDEEYATVKQAELALLSTRVRSDETHLAALLSADFAEIGRSGRRWTYQDTVIALRNEEPRTSPRTSEWLFNRLSSELVLVNYLIHGTDADSRHSSLWDTRGPVILFHQGTIVPSG